MRVAVVILAAGKSQRMGDEKIFLDLMGKTPLQMCLEVFAAHELIDRIVVCASMQNMAQARSLCAVYGADVVLGGELRQDSMENGLNAIDEEIVLFHDGARPLITPDIITRCVQTAREKGSAIASVPLKDTIKYIGENGVVSTPERSRLRAAQTPQAFSTPILKRALENARKKGTVCTDDAALLELMGIAPEFVMGSYENIKLTTPEDVAVAGAILASRGVQYGNPKSLRQGTGYDVHTLVCDRPLVLGGVEVPYEKGLMGHSDADVLTHAVMDALLGACGLRDIGTYFPDNDDAYKDICSLRLLERVREIIEKEGFSVVNVDSVIVAQRPKLAPYIERMVRNIALALGVEERAVAVKATTTEGLGFAGRGEGMAALAVAAVRALER